ncbi:aldolase [Rhodococcus sp. CX]|uniref:HpcH/HpaI aldolase family protein n=1 Tax=Rhodococcus sp. CX TaxID=2789880 RepID=UPI0018CCA40E|nr:aldolase/citrate lyase family protein [Rhodococcus sp. CX]MBH0121422.1 aldolase [Rhodococcus sp. CX]
MTSIPALLHVATPSLSIVESGLFNGYDGVVIDLQHGEVGLETACTMLRAIPRDVRYRYVRVASIDSGPIGRLMDSGARGIIAPTVESADEARALVAATKYPPLGRRSLGPSRPQLYSGSRYTEAGNDAVECIVQIETRRGLDAAEEILSVDGVGSVYIGPADLAVSFGLGGGADWADGPVYDAIVEIAKVARAYGRTCGIYAGSPTYAAALARAELIDYVGLGIDLVMVGAQARQNIASLRSES